MADSLKTAALVLSDLHFGADLLREAEVPPLQFPWWRTLLAPSVRRYMEAKCKAHDIGILLCLPLYLKKVLHQLRLEGLGESKFTFYLLLGDMSTYANGSSYVFLRQYLSQTHYSPQGLTKIQALDIPIDRLVMIPGNHDKLLRTNLDIYFQQFAGPLSFPGPLPMRSFFLTKKAGDTEFLFILVDASVYASIAENLDLSAREHLAMGRVSEELTRDIQTKLDQLKRGTSVDAAELKNYSQSRKILLVHYAVDDRAVLGSVLPRDELVLPHSCVGLDNLVKDLSRDLHLVVHGHLHCARIYNHHGVKVISATTTTQKNSKNGFFVLKFYDSGDLITEHHKWTGSGFVLDESRDLNVRMSLTQDSDALAL
jgi:calcineurin-like phosphoesterase family protein